MDDPSTSDFMALAQRRLAGPQAELLRALHRFTTLRLRAADRSLSRLSGPAAGPDAVQMELHAFLRQCWDALDGLGREVNLVMRHLFPEAGLYDPLEMTRQCTFYMVRKLLGEHPTTADHAVTRLLWERTRGAPEDAYRRLSFLHNVAIFFPIPLPGGTWLPGTDDLPPAARGIVKPQRVQRCDLREGVRELREWVGNFARVIYRALGDALEQSSFSQ